jgi:hypothetical protein
MSLADAQRHAGRIVLALDEPGSLRERVLAASVPSFMDLQADAAYEDYLPEALQKRIDALLMQLTERQLPEESFSALEASVSAMTERELAESAEEMVQIAAEVIEGDGSRRPALHAVQ